MKITKENFRNEYSLRLNTVSKTILIRIILVLLFLLYKLGLYAQCTFPLNFSETWEIQYPVNYSALTIQPDVNGNDVIYVASNELGLRIYDVSTSTPALITTLDTAMLSMPAMNVIQYGNYLYVSIGSHFLSSNDPPGMVIVDVTNPLAPVIKDTWIHTTNGSGTGIIKVEGNYAYLGGMGLGLFILDVSDPNNIVYKSNFVPDIDFPSPSPANPALYNARGMEVKNDIVYLCYDAGGLRIINCTNKLSPVETGRYANPITFVPWNMPRAYNNIILNDTIAYIAVDYCGLEIINISDTSSISLINHWNPHDCPVGTWNTSPIHANEMAFVPECNMLFIASGKSELLAINVTNPNVPDSCAMFGSLADTTGTWGLGLKGDKIFLGYTYVSTIWPSWLVPFYSTWSGVKCVSWNNAMCLSGLIDNSNIDDFIVYPNPANTEINIKFTGEGSSLFEVLVYDEFGRCCYHANRLNLSASINISGQMFTNGIYSIQIIGEKRYITKKIIINR